MKNTMQNKEKEDSEMFGINNEGWYVAGMFIIVIIGCTLVWFLMNLFV
jgi:hypothetical protein